MSGTIAWFVVGVICMVVELVSPMFIIAFFGLGAWAASLSMYLGAPLSISFGVFSVVCVLSLWLLRCTLMKTFQGSSHAAKETPEQTGLYLGKQATVTQIIKAGAVGEISLGGSFWRATLDADIATSTTSLEIGTAVVVTGHDPDDAILLQVKPS